MNIAPHTQPKENLIKHSLNNIDESVSVLKKKLFFEKKFVNKFKTNYSLGNYHFDFYFEELRLGIQIDALSYSYSNIYNNDSTKLMSIPHKNMMALKVSDYQVLVDSDEIIRFLKNYSL